MFVYPLEGQVMKDHWAGSRSWPTQSSVWSESLPRLHHHSHHRKELASPPVHWPPTHRINTHIHSVAHTQDTKNMSRIKAMCRSKCTNPSLIVYTFTPVRLNDKRVEEGNDHVFCNITCKNMRLTLTYPHVATFKMWAKRE